MKQNNIISWCLKLLLGGLSIISAILFSVLPLGYMITSSAIYFYLVIRGISLRDPSYHLGTITVLFFGFIYFQEIGWLAKQGFPQNNTITEYIIVNIAVIFIIESLLRYQGKVIAGDVIDAEEPIVFISYKSKDAHLARLIAETLIANRIYPWFAEYKISFSDWFDKDKINRLIESGISNSEYAILITNEDYFNSEYCKFEKDAILDTKKKDRILHIICPPEDTSYSKYPPLSELESVVYRGNNQSLFSSISKFIGEPIKYSYPDNHDGNEKRMSFKYRYENKEFDYSFDFKFFEVIVPDGRWYKSDFPCNIAGPYFRIDGDKFVVIAKIIAGTQCFPGRMNQDKIIDKLFIDELKVMLPDSKLVNKLPIGARISDDRVAYQMNMIFADDLYANKKYRPVGIHLLYLGGFSHGVYTFQSEGGKWHRRYSLQLPGHDCDFEIAVTFEASCRQIEFLVGAVIMDNFIKSLDVVVYDENHDEVIRHIH